MDAFRRAETLRTAFGPDHPVVLDAGCGTGQGTRRLSARHREALVVGVDRSAARLARVGAAGTPRLEGNALWLRADLATFWRLALAARWPVTHHYLLYPNPWPKSAQLGRRWHGHPVFPSLLALGGRLVLRSNWAIYVDEFALAVGLVTGRKPARRRFEVVIDAEDGDSARRAEGEASAREAPLTPFERKYAASGHALWTMEIKLP